MPWVHLIEPDTAGERIITGDDRTKSSYCKGSHPPLSWTLVFNSPAGLEYLPFASFCHDEILIWSKVTFLWVWSLRVLMYTHIHRWWHAIKSWVKASSCLSVGYFGAKLKTRVVSYLWRTKFPSRVIWWRGEFGNDATWNWLTVTVQLCLWILGVKLTTKHFALELCSTSNAVEERHSWNLEILKNSTGSISQM